MTATYLILQQETVATDWDAGEDINPQVNNLVIEELRQAVFKCFPVHLGDILEDAKLGKDECEYEGIDELKSDVLYSVFGTNYDDSEIGDYWETIVEEMIYSIFSTFCSAYSKMGEYLE